MNILLVEDDETIVRILKQELEKWGFEVGVVNDFNQVLSIFLEEKPQLVLMDLVLPYFNGYYWCEQIRKISTVPVIFISSRSENMDIIMGMQVGGDDYITKPLESSVTVAKIQAILRRSYDFGNNPDYLTHQDLYLYVGESKLRYKEEDISLTRTELQIMDSLFRAGGKFVSREQMMEKCWQGESYIDDSTLSVNMTRLRKKLRSVGLEEVIVTKKNVGYALSERVENQ